jgi:hypothetical protein
MVWHDDDRADVLAASYQDFLFRKMVEAVADYQRPYTLLSHGELAGNLRRWLQTHQPSCAATSTRHCSGCSPALTISLKELQRRRGTGHRR